MNLQKKLNCVNRKLNIAITRIANPYGHPNILAEFIAGQLRNRVSFRKAMKKAIELTQQAGTKGIQKLHVSNGSERVEFLYKPFELKLIIVPIYSSNYLWCIRDQSLDICKQRIIQFSFSFSLRFLVSVKQKNDNFSNFIRLNKKYQLIFLYKYNCYA
ncbi:hypothetical protein AHAS_AhasUnG0003600 [Arachis hypogaea]